MLNESFCGIIWIIKLYSMRYYVSSFILCVALFLGLFNYAQAGTPSGDNWFQLLTSHATGGDNTGDGGSGNPNDYNYYYVGQSFTSTIQINSTGTNASNIWIDYESATTSAANLTTGSYFPTWSNQTIAGGRIKSTGFRVTGVSSGVGTFGSVDFSLTRPTAANYSTSTPTVLDINIGTVGQTTDSNISYLGSDILQDAEDFYLHIWADTVKPYAYNASPADTATGVAVEDNYTFTLCDSKTGEGEASCLDSGVGTGVNTATPAGTLTFNDGGGATDYTSYDSYSCSGLWGTNECHATVNPTSPLGISGDQRNWQYNTTYTVNIGGFQDYASASQDQLGDANGPNAMNNKTWTFTTESDTTAPSVENESPTRGSSANSVSTNLTIDITDKKSNNVSGVGLDASTCKINVSSPSFALTTFTSVSAEVTVSSIDYGSRFTINPATDFGQSETVTVSVYDCQDLVGNTMTTDTYTFTTIDTGDPYLDDLNPLNDQEIAANGTVGFHLKDAAGGVNLNNTVIYVNGTYYSNGGGAGSLSLNGKTVSYTALDFNGSNYVGDTTNLTDVNGDGTDYAFVIDPEANFTAGEAIPVIVYSRDNSNNIMAREVYGLVAAGGGGTCDGSSYCGSNTNWDGSLNQCVGTGGGTCQTVSGGGGGSPVPPQITTHTAEAVQVNESTILINWFTNKPGTSRIVYGLNSVQNLGQAPNYGYSFSSLEDTAQKTYHSVVVNNLQAGQAYYFRPISLVDGQTVLGPELVMSPEFRTVCPTCPELDCPTCPTCQVCPDAASLCQDYLSRPTPSDIPASQTISKKQVTTDILEIISIKFNRTNGQRSILFEGRAEPSSKLKLIIY